MKKTIISVSGLRGIVGETIDPILAQRFVLAYATRLDPGPVIIGRDGRESGKMYAMAIASALMSSGFDVLDAGVCATPTVGVLVRDRQCSGGIQISASHNPKEYNGIKLFGPDGRVISAKQGQAVIEKFNGNDYQFAKIDDIGTCEALDDTASAHLQLVLSTVDVESIRKRNFKVVLDSNHGAGSVLAKPLLEALNCQFQILGDEQDGLFAHTPEPTRENLISVSEAAQAFGADVVFCQDPDADRLAIIDENGNYVGEEYTLALTLRHALSQAAGNGFGGYEKNVVINCATSRMSVDIAEEFGCQCLISSVGEANVTGQMIDSQAVYGGEGNGGPIDPRVGYVRDSFVGMAQTLDAMTSSGKTISAMAGEITPYSIVKSKMQMEKEQISDAFDQLESEFEFVNSSREDGLRLDFEDSWLLVRASNTEPIVRVIAEAKSSEQAETLVTRAQQIMETGR